MLNLFYQVVFPYNYIIIGLLIFLIILLISFIISCFCKKKLIGFFIGLLICLFVVGWENYPETKNYNVDFGLDKPVKIVELSDFHYNSTCPIITDIAINKCNRENPDIVVLLGDYKTNSGIYLNADLPDKFFNQLKRIKAKKIYAVYGNHDRFEHEEKINAKFRDLNIILCDKQIFLEDGFILGGVNLEPPNVKKKVRHRKRVRYINSNVYFSRDILKRCPKDSKIVFLYHSPQMLLRYLLYKDIVKDKNILFITGHTHGGQVVLPFENKREKAQKMFKIDYLSGMAEKNNQKVIISKGLGNGFFPLRFGARPEVTVINLK